MEGWIKALNKADMTQGERKFAHKLHLTLLEDEYFLTAVQTFLGAL